MTISRVSAFVLERGFQPYCDILLLCCSLWVWTCAGHPNRDTYAENRAAVCDLVPHTSSVTNAVVGQLDPLRAHAVTPKGTFTTRIGKEPFLL
jgi:hypothetical protein